MKTNRTAAAKVTQGRSLPSAVAEARRRGAQPRRGAEGQGRRSSTPAPTRRGRARRRARFPQARPPRFRPRRRARGTTARRPRAAAGRRSPGAPARPWPARSWRSTRDPCRWPRGSLRAVPRARVPWASDRTQKTRAGTAPVATSSGDELLGLGAKPPTSRPGASWAMESPSAMCSLAKRHCCRYPPSGAGKPARSELGHAPADESAPTSSPATVGCSWADGQSPERSGRAAA